MSKQYEELNKSMELSIRSRLIRFFLYGVVTSIILATYNKEFSLIYFLIYSLCYIIFLAVLRVIYILSDVYLGESFVDYLNISLIIFVIGTVSYIVYPYFNFYLQTGVFDLSKASIAEFTEKNRDYLVLIFISIILLEQYANLLNTRKQIELRSDLYKTKRIDKENINSISKSLDGIKKAIDNRL